MTVVIQYANAYLDLKNQDLRSNAFVETKTTTPLMTMSRNLRVGQSMVRVSH